MADATEHSETTGAAEHSTTNSVSRFIIGGDLNTLVNIGLMQSALRGQNNKLHMANIQSQVHELFDYHSSQFLCFVETGQPRVELSPASKKTFETAMRSEAPEHVSGVSPASGSMNGAIMIDALESINADHAKHYKRRKLAGLRANQMTRLL